MRCEARVPRAPGDHDDRGNLAAHRCTRPARASGLCGIHEKQLHRRGYVALWEDVDD